MSRSINLRLVGLAFAIAWLGCRSPSAVVDSGAPDSGQADAGVEPPDDAGTLAGCPMFPADNAWNADVSDSTAYPVHPLSAHFIARINADAGTQKLHADFGSDLGSGIPYTLVPAGQPGVATSFDVPDESDPGPYPIPDDAKIEAGSDGHVLVLQAGVCKLFELGQAMFSNPGWHAYSGAVFDLRSNALRPDTWTSADAAGLPILPGLVRYDEVAAGQIRHAVRFTSKFSQRGFIHPATHQAGHPTDAASPDAFDPPMGLRLRLQSSFNLGPYTGQSLVILTALKKYGMILADNGSSWFISGASDARFDDNDLNQLKTVPGSAFEAVDTGPVLH